MRTEFFTHAHPDRFFEFYIAEQQMVAAAVGMQVRGRAPFAATFAAFMSRALDFIRMAAISRADRYDGRPGRDHLPADYPERHASHLPARGGVSGWR